MKLTLAAILSSTIIITAIAAPVLPPPAPIPAPQVSLSWTLPVVAQMPTNVYVWYGDSTRQYTNKTLVGFANNATVTLPARGVKFYFTVTMVYSNNVESPYSNEVDYTAPTFPPAVLNPPAVLVVKNRPITDPTTPWSEFAKLDVPPGPGQAFQLSIVGNTPTLTPITAVSPHQKAVSAMRAVINRPPSPL